MRDKIISSQVGTVSPALVGRAACVGRGASDGLDIMPAPFAHLGLENAAESRRRCPKSTSEPSNGGSGEVWPKTSEGIACDNIVLRWGSMKHPRSSLRNLLTFFPSALAFLSISMRPGTRFVSQRAKPLKLKRGCTVKCRKRKSSNGGQNLVVGCSDSFHE